MAPFCRQFQKSLKCVLLHNENLYGSVPLGHSTTLKEKYDEINLLWKKFHTNSSNRSCVDLKMVGFLLGIQSGYTKFPCFLCLWDSRARKEHWTKKDWHVRRELIPDSLNVQTPPLVERSKIVLPRLHIKLGIMKQFVKALEKDGDCVRYICMKFPSLSIKKLKAGVFDGPQIRKLMKDANFCNYMNPGELSAWSAFTNVVKFFLRKTKAPNHQEIVETLASLRHLGANMSIKLHFLHSHLCPFSKKSERCERRAGVALPSRHRRHRSSLSRSLGCHHACRLLLVYQVRRCRILTF